MGLIGFDIILFLLALAVSKARQQGSHHCRTGIYKNNVPSTVIFKSIDSQTNQNKKILWCDFAMLSNSGHLSSFTSVVPSASALALHHEPPGSATYVFGVYLTERFTAGILDLPLSLLFKSSNSSQHARVC